MAEKPALPWGHHSNAPPAQTDGDAFESGVRKMVLFAALGGLSNERPAKRARTEGDAVVRPGSAEDANADGAEAEESVPADLAAGQRIEVLWQLEEGETTTSKWWGAVLVERKDAPASAEGDAAPAAAQTPAAAEALAAEAAPAGETWTLRYDAHGDFPQEEKQATLLTKHVLMHGGDMDDAPLAWRMEGEAYEPESDDDSSDEEEGEENEWARSLPVSAIGRAIDAQMGCSVEAAALQRMQASLPIEQQQSMAAGFNSFITHLTDSLRQTAADKAAESGSHEGVVIIKDDVEAALASWQAERDAA